MLIFIDIDLEMLGYMNQHGPKVKKPFSCHWGGAAGICVVVGKVMRTWYSCPCCVRIWRDYPFDRPFFMLVTFELGELRISECSYCTHLERWPGANGRICMAALGCIAATACHRHGWTVPVNVKRLSFNLFSPDCGELFGWTGTTGYFMIVD